ncbi:MAG: hypothetical protein R2867_28395 [Caldilineaceae bacterium]
MGALYYVAGACGFTSGLVNVTTELSLEMEESLALGNYDNAMRIWQQIKPLRICADVTTPTMFRRSKKQWPKLVFVSAQSAPRSQNYPKQNEAK